MGRQAERVYTEQRDIARIESWAEQLQDEAMVAVELADGRRVEGVVTARPTVQVFQDARGREGLNALVRIDDARDPAQAHYLWLDRIVGIRRIGTA